MRNNELINKNINDAYNEQSEQVRRLFDHAKKNMANEKEHDYALNKYDAQKIRTISRVITKNKEKDNSLENRVNKKLEEMQEKLDLNYKSLYVIYENNEKDKKNENEELQKIKNNITESNEKMKSSVENYSNQIGQNIEKVQNEIVRTVKEKQSVTKKEVRNLQNIVTEKFKENNEQSKKQLEELRKSLEPQIEKTQELIEESLERVAKQNEEKIESLKTQVLQIYREENALIMNNLIQENINYKNTIKQKDDEIREINKKLHECEERLEKEISKRQKFSIFTFIFRKEEVKEEEEETFSYASQILNGAY